MSQDAFCHPYRSTANTANRKPLTSPTYILLQISMGRTRVAHQWALSVTVCVVPRVNLLLWLGVKKELYQMP